MKKNKKVLLALSFWIGALMLVTTAFADISSKSGYDQLKDAVKSTFKNLSENTRNFTFEGTITIKNNNQLLISNSTVQKIDNANIIKEDVTTIEYQSGKKRNTYSYRDRNMFINYNSDSDIYLVSEYSSPVELEMTQNPFEDDRVKDIEKIADALVGSLKNHVVVNEKGDGSKEFSGTLNDGEIPPLINAISSFLIKRVVQDDIGDEDVSIPKLRDDIFIKQVEGKAYANGNGTIESLYGTFTLSGKDKDGITHELCFEILLKIYDIDSTVVTKPDLTGKKVERREIKNQANNIITNLFIGKYKNDVVILENGSFVKIGERIVTVDYIDDKHVIGQYMEIFKEGYENYRSVNDFVYDAEIQESDFATFAYTNAAGNQEEGFITFDSYTGKIYFYITPGSKNSTFDPTFSRVFEE